MYNIFRFRNHRRKTRQNTKKIKQEADDSDADETAKLFRVSQKNMMGLSFISQFRTIIEFAFRYLEK
jgi:hypothetical protein